MSYREFCEKVAKLLREFLGEGYKVGIKEVIKNNSVKMIGLDAGVEGDSVSQIMYMENSYAEYLEGRLSVVEAAENAMKNFKSNLEQPPIDVSEVRALLEWDMIKGKVMSRLINTEMNKELLQTLPHREFLDLSIIYYIYATDDSTMNITNQHIEYWGVDEEQLYDCAKVNVGKAESVFKSMSDMIAEILELDVNESTKERKKTQADAMFVLTNRRRYLGSIYLTDEDVMKRIKEKIGNFVIIPSCIHELIILPQKDFSNYYQLAQMVKNMNASEVEKQDVLSNHVYLYRGDGVEIVA